MNLARRESIWRIADQVRSILDLSSSSSFDLEEIIYRLGGNIKYIGFDEAEKERYNANFEAALRTASVLDGDPDLVGFSVIVAGWKNKQRLRFSVAHEIGHLVLHLLTSGGKIKPAQDTYRNLQSSEEELEANEFAAAFLMPTDLFTEFCENYAESHGGKIDMEKVAEQFDVSTSAATVRGSVLSLW